MKVVVIGLTGLIGWITTADVEPEHAITLHTWCILLIACGVVLAFINAHNDRQSTRKEIIKRLDEQDQMQRLMLDSQQQSMRTDLIHKSEKYLERGWLTSEELQAWSDMYGVYSKLGLNGYVGSYLKRLDSLKIEPLDKISKEYEEHE